MNIEQAKAVSLYDIIVKLGYNPVKVGPNEYKFPSPLRDEKTPSFYVNTQKNVWFDHGTGKGGGILQFVRSYLEANNESNTIPDVLRWTSNMSGSSARIKSINTSEYVPSEPKLKIKSVNDIEHIALVKYLEKRGIAVPIARSHLKEVHVENVETKKSFFALGMENEEKGFELRNPFFKGTVGKKSISFIRGSVAKPSGIYIFEGPIDFLSLLTHLKREQLDDDAIILNSVACLEQATPYIKDYGYQTARTWMDNDDAGQKAKQALDDFFKLQEGLTHRPMNELYQPHKDVNDWLVQTLKLGE